MLTFLLFVYIVSSLLRIFARHRCGNDWVVLWQQEEEWRQWSERGTTRTHGWTGNRLLWRLEGYVYHKLNWVVILLLNSSAFNLIDHNYSLIQGSLNLVWSLKHLGLSLLGGLLSLTDTDAKNNLASPKTNTGKLILHKKSLWICSVLSEGDTFVMGDQN